MFGLARRMLTRVVRGMRTVTLWLVNRVRRRQLARDAEHRARLLLAPMEERDHTGNLAGGIALAALGYQFTDPLEGMALAVGDLAMLSVAGSNTSASQPTVGDPPQPLTAWLPDEPITLDLTDPAESESASYGELGNANDSGWVGVAGGLMDDFWLAPAEAAPNAGSGAGGFDLGVVRAGRDPGRSRIWHESVHTRRVGRRIGPRHLRR